jgi:hypothetical protein
MLTREEQSQIKQLLDENNGVVLQKIELGIDEKLGNKLNLAIRELEKGIDHRLGNKLNLAMEELEGRIDKKLEKRLKPLLKELRKLRRDLNVTITSFDRDIIYTRRRVDRIEDHLQLPTIQIS